MELTEQNPQAFKQNWWKRIECELHIHKTNTKLAPSRAAAARRVLFRLPTGAPDKFLVMRHRPTCLLLSLTVVRIVTANVILETPGPPAFARGILAHLRPT